MISKLNKFINSIDSLLAEEKEQKLKSALGNELREKIFTDEITNVINENDFSGLVDEEDEIIHLFSSIFPIVIKKEDVIFRMYKHKIEVDLLDKTNERYIYIFSDGRLTSGLFECFGLLDSEYLNIVKKMIENIPVFKHEIIISIANFNHNKYIHNSKILNRKDKENIMQNNFNQLMTLLKN